MQLRSLWLSLAGSLILASSAYARSFEDWLVDIEAQAVNAGVSASIARDALRGLEENARVVALDKKQPENKITLTKYLSNTISERRINTGRAMMEEHRDVLEKISAKYGVQPQYIVALWGIESDYGSYQGDFSVVRSLATLAYEGRRKELFTKELIAALKILDKENLASSELTGSWAGAMGNCQFMPSTYLAHAADGDGDGDRDIWNSTPDTLASIANYLHSLGWKNDRGWGAKAEASADFGANRTSITHAKTAAEWKQHGLSWEENGSINSDNTPLYAIHAGKPHEGLYVVTSNYKAILQWNRSRYFATAVGTLADAIGE